MDPVTITIAGVVLVVIVLIALRPLRKIALSTRTVTVAKDASFTVVMTLVYKGWFGFSFDMLPGTITSWTGSSVISIAPLTVTTAGGTPVADLVITGMATGTATITVNGTSVEGTHSTETIAVTVV